MSFWIFPGGSSSEKAELWEGPCPARGEGADQVGSHSLLLVAVGSASIPGPLVCSCALVPLRQHWIREQEWLRADVDGTQG